ncbi:uncharacterized protein SOCEGT47_056730 [Sorangium cellulosum]|uniref:CD-NTase-associated protein 12/Pycsar effector protein TIR domain-containing protein n=1 Tax=Sorangium cellulosum TaxID=56 RepID=A0A4P2Q6T3_SORCE|nr:nucleotide-binding protein [Sorangium cellulosum]AUX25129.1 uncharacterized protein SOCEGT47_056730 [Sorangium cellulosum]
MSIKEDAGRILYAIAEFEESPGDPRRGRHNLTGHGVQRALKDQQKFDLDPERINDGVALLENNGYVNIRHFMGTAPYAFGGVELTPAGRLEYENSKNHSQPSRAAPTKSANPDKKKVFVIHGRDEKRRKAMFDFLRSIGLQPIEWSQARAMTGKAAPYIGEILDAAFDRAQAVVALLTGDDEARLRPELLSAGENEEALTPQARANVLFEAGMAMGSHADRTVFVEIGRLRTFSDIAGRHTVRITQDPQSSIANRQEIAARLHDAGCDVDISGTDWHTAGSFW